MILHKNYNKNQIMMIKKDSIKFQIKIQQKVYSKKKYSILHIKNNLEKSRFEKSGHKRKKSHRIFPDYND